jgi:hypothetical protein
MRSTPDSPGEKTKLLRPPAPPGRALVDAPPPAPATTTTKVHEAAVAWISIVYSPEGVAAEAVAYSALPTQPVTTSTSTGVSSNDASPALAKPDAATACRHQDDRDET